MKKKTIKALAAAALIMSSAAVAYAVPAQPGIHRFQQADGTTVNVQLVGDEYHAYYTSEDSYVLVNEDGLLYFAELDDAGNIVASQWRATDVASRSGSLKSFLSTLSKDDMVHAMSMQGAEARQQAAERNGLFRAPMAKAGAGLFDRVNFPSTGDRKVLVVLVEYQDVKFTLNDPHAYFTDMFTKSGFNEYGGTGSVRDFYDAASCGQFRPQFDIYGPVTLPNDMAYYGAHSGSSNDIRPGDMAKHACELLDDKINFADYDTNNDGIIDNVFIYYAGRGEATGGAPETVWPHQGSTSGTFDGKRLSHYACTNEWNSDNTPAGIGTFVHEFGHVLGLPDLYATQYPTPAPFTPGSWDTMDQASYNNNGRTPALYSSFERYALGWVEPTEITGTLNGKLNPLADANECYVINTANSGEYFILENRQQKGWDKYIPGHGMLIWHIDYLRTIWDRNSCSNNANHQYVDIEEADNIKTEATRDGDAFPGSANVTSFGDNTTPSMVTWTSQRLNMPITDIKESAPSGIITFKVKGGVKAQGTTALAAKDVTPRSFTASWNAQAQAKSYQLSVYTTAGDGTKTYAPGFNHRNVGNTTSFQVTGLEPSTSYLYSVVCATDDATSDPSNEIGLNTLALTHEYVIPEVLAATNVTDESFDANWKAVDGATDYELDVYQRHISGGITEKETFAGNTATWFSSSSSFNNTKIYYGEGAPSLKLTDENYISSPYTSGVVSSFKFWHRGQRTATDARIVIEALIDDCWTPVAFVPVNTKSGGSTTTLNSFPAGTKAVRAIVYNSTDNGVVYVDDFEMTSGGTETRIPVDGFTAKATGNVVTFPVTGLNPGSDHFYSIRAIKGGAKSMKSAEMYIKTTGEQSGIDGINGDASDISVIANGGMISVTAPAGLGIAVNDLSGRALYLGTTGMTETSLSVAPGIYLVTVGGNTVKVIVK